MLVIVTGGKWLKIVWQYSAIEKDVFVKVNDFPVRQMPRYALLGDPQRRK